MTASPPPARRPGDFGGSCLIGDCTLDPALVLPDSSYFGLQKAGSFFFGTWRDLEGNLRRAVRGIMGETSPFNLVFAAKPGRQLEQVEVPGGSWLGAVTIDRFDDTVGIRGLGGSSDPPFEFVQHPGGCSWSDGEALAVTGSVIGPGLQWFNTWDGGACLAVTTKFRTSGTHLGVPVEGFVGHEIHYMPAGANWITSPYADGREFCWQHVANEYEDGSTIQGTFAYGADGWGFAMLHDESGAFHATTDVRATATVRPNGYPETITYEFLDQSWTWRIDPQGERPVLGDGGLLGADGTCRRDGDDRPIHLSLGNSDWWTDGRATSMLRR